ncbi:MAG: molybdopterin-dependent oxidoreductase [Deltaproteobacteria bacterium]|nr:molybdopterin-dependent oxidoreductase [Deltaproteobacteria bacterium]
MKPLDFDKKVRTTCPSPCVLQCTMNAYLKDGKVVWVEPAPAIDGAKEHICAKALTIIQDLIYSPDRLKYPLKRIGKRGEGKWQRITWDEALDIVAKGIKNTREKYGPRSVLGFSVANQVHQLGVTLAERFSNLLESTIPNPVTWGDSGGFLANAISFGFIQASHETRDVINSKFYILWGTNPAETHPPDMRDILEGQARGAKIVVIDPLFTPTAAKADWWIPIRPNTDGALALGMAKLIIDRNLYDRDFLRQFTVAPFLVREDNGSFLREKDIIESGSDDYLCWDDRTGGHCKPQGAAPALDGSHTINGMMCKTAFQCLVDHLKDYTLDKVSRITEVPEETIEKLAMEYAENKPAGIKGFWGLQRGFHGHQNVRSLHLLGALTGNIGIPGGGVSDWRSPEFYASFGDPPMMKPADDKRATWVSLPRVNEIMLTDKPYPIKTFFTRGSFLTQIADTNTLINDILPKLDLIVVSDLFMTTTAEYADIVLPGATAFESTELNLWPFPYMRFAPKVIEPIHECKSDFWLFKELGKRLGFGKYFDYDEESLISELLESPRLKGVTLPELKKGPIKTWLGEAPYVMFEDKRFETPSGRMEFYAEQYAKAGEALPSHKESLEASPFSEKAKEYPLIFFSTHSRWRFNSCFQNSKWVREFNPEPELEINPADTEIRGISQGDMVEVFNDRGRCRVKAKVTPGIRPGIVNIKQGFWVKEFEEGSHNHLTHNTINEVQDMNGLANIPYNDVLVEVKSCKDITVK